MSAARAERLLNLLTLLLNTRRPVSLRELRELEEFAAFRTDDPKSGERAFERDKAALIELGVPLRWVPPERDDEADTTDGLGGYLIDRDRYYLPELALEPAEAAVLSIVGAAAAGLDHFPGRAALLRALGKVGFDTVEAQAPRGLVHAAVVAPGDAERIAGYLEVLQAAVADRQFVHVGYRGVSGELTRRRVAPYGLYYRQGAWYLVAHCELRQAERTFHVGRISALHVDSPAGAFTVPDGVDIRAHAHRRPWAFPNGAPVRVTVRLAAHLVPAVDELFGTGVERELADDGVRVHLPVTHMDALIAAVLPHGADAEVVAPPEVRARLRAIYRGLMSLYDADPRAGASP